MVESSRLKSSYQNSLPAYSNTPLKFKMAIENEFEDASFWKLFFRFHINYTFLGCTPLFYQGTSGVRVLLQFEVVCRHTKLPLHAVQLVENRPISRG